MHEGPRTVASERRVVVGHAACRGRCKNRARSFPSSVVLIPSEQANKIAGPMRTHHLEIELLMPCFGSLVCSHLHTIRPKTHTRRPAVSLMRRAFTAAPKIQSFLPEFGFKSLANRLPQHKQSAPDENRRASIGAARSVLWPAAGNACFGPARGQRAHCSSENYQNYENYDVYIMLFVHQILNNTASSVYRDMEIDITALIRANFCNLIYTIKYNHQFCCESKKIIKFLVL